MIIFANKLNSCVIGGVSKLLAYFIKNNNTSFIISYSDNLITNGDVYEKVGFDCVKILQPTYTNIVNHNRSIDISDNFSKIFNAGYKKWILELRS